MAMDITTKEVEMTTYTGRCSCGCGESVAVSYGGFAATTATVAACSRLRAAGVVSTEVRRSAAPVEVSSAALRHRDGLVSFA